MATSKQLRYGRSLGSSFGDIAPDTLGEIADKELSFRQVAAQYYDEETNNDYLIKNKAYPINVHAIALWVERKLAGVVAVAAGYQPAETQQKKAPSGPFADDDSD